MIHFIGKKALFTNISKSKIQFHMTFGSIAIALLNRLSVQYPLPFSLMLPDLFYILLGNYRVKVANARFP